MMMREDKYIHSVFVIIVQVIPQNLNFFLKDCITIFPKSNTDFPPFMQLGARILSGIDLIIMPTRCFNFR